MACSTNYGSLQRINDVSKAFERHEVLADPTYCATGPEARPTAILGGVIADPAGKQAGAWYSFCSRTTIRLEPET